jgi:hypothetical protein
MHQTFERQCVEFLKNKIGVNNSERHNVVENIFGNAGVLDVNDT